jgi:hypothetical protein
MQGVLQQSPVRASVAELRGRGASIWLSFSKGCAARRRVRPFLKFKATRRPFFLHTHLMSPLYISADLPAGSGASQLHVSAPNGATVGPSCGHLAITRRCSVTLLQTRTVTKSSARKLPPRFEMLTVPRSAGADALDALDALAAAAAGAGASRSASVVTSWESGRHAAAWLPSVDAAPWADAAELALAAPRSRRRYWLPPSPAPLNGRECCCCCGDASVRGGRRTGGGQHGHMRETVKRVFLRTQRAAARATGAAPAARRCALSTGRFSSISTLHTCMRCQEDRRCSYKEDCPHKLPTPHFCCVWSPFRISIDDVIYLEYFVRSCKGDRLMKVSRRASERPKSAGDQRQAVSTTAMQWCYRITI